MPSPVCSVLNPSWPEQLFCLAGPLHSLSSPLRPTRSVHVPYLKWTWETGILYPPMRAVASLGLHTKPSSIHILRPQTMVPTPSSL